MKRLVVVGAGLAGLRAAEEARARGFDGELTLIGAEAHPPYDRPPLSKEALLAPAAPDTTLRSRDELEAGLALTLRLGDAAVGLDTGAGAVRLASGDAVAYDALIIATGATARKLPAADALDGVVTLRTVDDSRRVRAGVDAGGPVVVVGAGFIGSEVASAARARGLDVTIVEAAPTPLVRAVGDGVGGLLSGLHERNGTHLITGVGVAGIRGAGRAEEVVLDDGRVLPASLVVVGVGADPACGWLDGSGLEVDGGVVCDSTLRASAPGVFAAGDVASWINPLFGRRMRLEHWTSALDQAVAAARAAVTGDAVPFETVPYFWSDWYGSRIQFVGVPTGDRVEIVENSLEDEGRLVALYSDGDRLMGALAVGRSSRIMKLRALIARRGRRDEAVAMNPGAGGEQPAQPRSEGESHGLRIDRP